MKDNKNSKFIYFGLGIIATILVVFLLFKTIGGGEKTRTKNKQSDSESNTSVLASPVATSTPSPTIVKPTPTKFEYKYTLSPTFTHDGLPGFEIDAKDGWEVEFSDFDEAKSSFRAEFVDDMYRYFECENCFFGLRISNDRVYLDLLFYNALDANASICSDDLDFEKISSDIYKVNSYQRIFYTSNIKVNIPLSKIGGGLIDEALPDDVDYEKTYKFCTSFEWGFLEKFRIVEYADHKNEVPVLMENPSVYGSPTDQDLKDIEDMLMSIKGF